MGQTSWRGRISIGCSFCISRRQRALLELAIGERVMFEDNDGRTQAGIVIRRNRNTVTVHGDTARQWNVSPQLLRKEKRAGELQGGKLVPFPRKV